LKQNGASVSDYYTSMQGIGEEIDAMSDLPGITTTTAHIATFLTAIAKQQEEMKLFQFLNGLDEV